MSEVKLAKTFIIQHKTTKELFHAQSGKTSWKAPGHAKNAFHQTLGGWNIEEYGLTMLPDPSYYFPDRKRPPKFGEQDVWEIVELKHEAQSRLDEAITLLNKCLGRCNADIHNEIVEFLENE